MASENSWDSVVEQLEEHIGKALSRNAVEPEGVEA